MLSTQSKSQKSRQSSQMVSASQGSKDASERGRSTGAPSGTHVLGSQLLRQGQQVHRKGVAELTSDHTINHSAARKESSKVIRTQH